MSAIYEWCCKNRECNMRNIVEQIQIDEAIKNGLKPLLICANCGIGHDFNKPGTPKGANYLACIPFEGWESRLPLGIQPDGTIVDFQGKKFQGSPNDFLTKNGVDAEQYLTWKNSAKPKPVHSC